MRQLLFGQFSCTLLDSLWEFDCLDWHANLLIRGMCVRLNGLFNKSFIGVHPCGSPAEREKAEWIVSK